MSPRKRNSKSRGLPENLYVNGKYFQYRNPVTGEKTSLNMPLAEAVRLAKQANARLAHVMADDGALLAALTGEKPQTVEVLVGRFEAEYLQERRYSDRTRKEFGYKLALYLSQPIGKCLVRSITVEEAAEFLDTFPGNAYTKHRALLIQLWRFAMAKGMADSNPWEITLRKQEAEKLRKRHTPEGILAILEHESCPAWLNRAIRLAIFSLQRREDLVNIERNAVDLDAGVLLVTQGKTEGYEEVQRLAIRMGGDLRAVVKECLASPIASPLLIHYRPKSTRRAHLNAKVHWTAVTPDNFTKTFAAVRDASGAYANLGPGERPPVHELRAFGAWLYKKAGYPEDYTQALMGHANANMTRYYQGGHEVEYKAVSAELGMADLLAVAGR